MINEVKWCDTDVCLADIMTKSGSKLTRTALEVVRNDMMVNLSFSKKMKREAENGNFLKQGEPGCDQIHEVQLEKDDTEGMSI